MRSVEVRFLKPWVGHQAGDLVRAQPNVADMWCNLRVAELVPVTVSTVQDEIDESVARKRGWPKGKPRKVLSVEEP